MEDRVRDLEQQLQRHQQLGIALPNKFDDGDRQLARQLRCVCRREWMERRGPSSSNADAADVTSVRNLPTARRR